MRDRGNFLVAFIRSLPPRAEFWIVITVGFGWFTLVSAATVFAQGYSADASTSGLIELAAFEVAIGVLLGWFLYIRNWRPRDLGFERPGLRDAAEALMLIAADRAVMVALSFLVGPVVDVPAAGDASADSSGGTSIWFALVFSIINSTFEEVFVCAYVLSGWRGATMWNAITASAAIRMAYHLYQGPLNALMIGSLGLIFGWFYAIRGRIWPLIIAHALLDFLYLMPATPLSGP